MINNVYSVFKVTRMLPVKLTCNLVYMAGFKINSSMSVAGDLQVTRMLSVKLTCNLMYMAGFEINPSTEVSKF